MQTNTVGGVDSLIPALATVAQYLEGKVKEKKVNQLVSTHIDQIKKASNPEEIFTVLMGSLKNIYSDNDLTLAEKQQLTNVINQGAEEKIREFGIHSSNNATNLLLNKAGDNPLLKDEADIIKNSLNNGEISPEDANKLLSAFSQMPENKLNKKLVFDYDKTTPVIYEITSDGVGNIVGSNVLKGEKKGGIVNFGDMKLPSSMFENIRLGQQTKRLENERLIQNIKNSKIYGKHLKKQDELREKSILSKNAKLLKINGQYKTVTYDPDTGLYYEMNSNGKSPAPIKIDSTLYNSGIKPNSLNSLIIRVQDDIKQYDNAIKSAQVTSNGIYNAIGKDDDLYEKVMGQDISERAPDEILSPGEIETFFDNIDDPKQLKGEIYKKLYDIYQAKKETERLKREYFNLSRKLVLGGHDIEDSEDDSKKGNLWNFAANSVFVPDTSKNK